MSSITFDLVSAILHYKELEILNIQILLKFSVWALLVTCSPKATNLVWTCVIVVMPSVIHVLDYCGVLVLGRASVMFSIFGHLACRCHGRKYFCYCRKC